jgi:hypothetical protein
LTIQDLDRPLFGFIASPTYSFTSTGKMVVESKADMKNRGVRSPDLADAFLLTFARGERRKAEKIPQAGSPSLGVGRVEPRLCVVA